MMITRLCLEKFLCLIIACALTAPSTMAGDNTNLEPGQRVRIDYDTTVTKRIVYIIPYHITEVRKLTGELVSMDSDSIIITVDNSDGQDRTIEISVIRNIYVNAGQRRMWPEGLSAGLGFGLIFSFAAIQGHHPIDSVTGQRIDDRDPLRDGVIILAESAVVGFVIGWFIKTDRWQKVDKSSWSAEPSLSLQGEIITIGMTFRF